MRASVGAGLSASRNRQANGRLTSGAFSASASRSNLGSTGFALIAAGGAGGCWLSSQAEQVGCGVSFQKSWAFHGSLQCLQGDESCARKFHQSGSIKKKSPTDGGSRSVRGAQKSRERPGGSSTEPGGKPTTDLENSATRFVAGNQRARLRPIRSIWRTEQEQESLKLGDFQAGHDKRGGQDQGGNLAVGLHPESP